MRNNESTVGALLACGYSTLRIAGIESYQIDSQLLLSNVMGKDRIFILTHRELPVEAEKAEEYFKLLGMRAKKMPVKYILGECEFMGYIFKVNEGVLIPRPDTEILVENAIFYIKRHGYSEICDVCTGSGIIGITVAKECPETNVLCLDISEVAVETARANSVEIGVEDRVKIEQSDLLEYALCRNLKFDVIASNPPYIRTGDMEGLMDDVRNYEPYEALCGGADGLSFYRRITEQSLRTLNDRGMLAFEIGYDQKVGVMKILEKYGFKGILDFKDLAGNDRVVLGFKN
ncbi:MAG: peptide chain release factor N(5)-glutamine methyltransferase [Clostridiaceae bacterium]